MIALDTNVLVYAHRREASEHTLARELVRNLAEGKETWAIPWPCLYEFLSVVTNPRIWKSAATTSEHAWLQVEAWCASPSLLLISESDNFLEVLATFARRPRVRGPIIHDARIAALCVAHDVEALVTRDRDFSLFPELRTRNVF